MNFRKTLILCALAVSAAAVACGQQAPPPANPSGPTPSTSPSTASSSPSSSNPGATAAPTPAAAPSTTASTTGGATTAAAGNKPVRTAAASDGGAAPYVVKDGNKVDGKTLLGWRTWRALACERCHGAEQEGLVGPPLVDSMKRLSKEEFHKTIMDGRPEKGMPPFSASKMVNDNWEGLYGYLKGRSDGKIKPGRVEPLEAKK